MGDPQDPVTVNVPEGEHLLIKSAGGVRTISPEEIREMTETDEPVEVR